MSRKTEENKQSKSTVSTMKKWRFLLGYLKPYALSYGIGWLCLLFSTLAGLLFPYLMGGLLGADTQGGTMDSIAVLLATNTVNAIAIALFALFGTQAIFSFLRVVLFNNVTENALRDLRNDAFGRLIYMPMDFFNRNKVGELTSRMASDISQIQETLRTTIAEFFRQIVVVVGGIVFLFFISWKLCLIMLGTVPIMAIIAVFFGRFIRKLSKEAQDFTAVSNSIIEEALMGIANVKAFTNEVFNLNRYKENTQKMRDLQVKSGVWRGVFVSFIIFCLFGAIVFIIWQGMLMTQGPSPTLAKEGFYQFILFTIMMGASIGSLPELYANIQKSIGSVEHLLGLISTPTEHEVNKGTKKPDVHGNIAFKNVTFHYPQRKEVTVLENISFEVAENSTLALVGSSGSGKSTIASLILRYYEPVEGEILHQGTSASQMNIEHLRNHIAIVPQEVLLFADTIRENIKFGRPEATEEELIEAAKAANAWEFISQFPEGLATQVGDRGIQLSGGQKQRIAIARAILKNPKILILDEATSALDSASEKLVQDALDRLMANRTAIVIAHRLSTIRKANKILVLQEGKIIEQGTHESLLSQNGAYSRLVELQNLSEA
ncbi:MAG: hypothetical protein RIQ90_1918 [Bacteroidota bacterium]|jgi:ABC-type multidrug transport system fused ATPase/permease subunit